MSTNKSPIPDPHDPFLNLKSTSQDLSYKEQRASCCHSTDVETKTQRGKLLEIMYSPSFQISLALASSCRSPERCLSPFLKKSAPPPHTTPWRCQKTARDSNSPPELEYHTRMPTAIQSLLEHCLSFSLVPPLSLQCRSGPIKAGPGSEEKVISMPRIQIIEAFWFKMYPKSNESRY